MSLRCAALALCLGCASPAAPVLASATPARATAGAQVVVTGARLCGPSGDCSSAGGELDLGVDQPVRATIVAYSATQLTFAVPPAANVGSSELVLTVDDTASNALAFVVEAAAP